MRRRSVILALAAAALMRAQHRVDPARDKANPAAIKSFQIPSHGAMLNALVYVATGAGPHPAVVLLHGFPGNERNLDLAQDIRRAGWDVLYFNYRGSWGSPGEFSFTRGIEDVASALAYLRKPEVASKLRLDPSRIVLIGHSMGGFMAVQGGAADPSVKAIGLISAADLAGRVPQPLPADREAALRQALSKGYEHEGMAPLAGCTPDSLASDTIANAAQWRFLSKADALKSRPMLIVDSDDGLAPDNTAFAAALRRAGNERVKALHFPTDHSYSDQRLALANAVIEWLGIL